MHDIAPPPPEVETLRFTGTIFWSGGHNTFGAACREEMRTGGTTVRLAEAVPPLPLSVDVTAPVVLFCMPVETAVTLTANEQAPEAAKVDPAKLTEVDPAMAVIVPLPHEPATPLGVATTSPAGKGSVKPTSLRAPAF
jgi:hypothetical protein